MVIRHSSVFIGRAAGVHFIPVVLVSLALASVIGGCRDSPSGEPSARRTIRPIPADATPEVRQRLERLGDSDAHERAEAAFLLGELGQAATAAVPHLLDALKDDNWRVRSRAAEALGKIADPRAVEPLIELLKTSDSDWEVRARAVESLGRLQDRRATETLMASLQDMVTHVRYQAAVALGTIQDPTAVDALEKVVQYDPDPTVRNGAQQSLRTIENRK